MGHLGMVDSSVEALKKQLAILEAKVEKHDELLRSLISLNAKGRVFDISRWMPAPDAV